MTEHRRISQIIVEYKRISPHAAEYNRISTWKDKESVVKWHKNTQHRVSQNKGKEKIFKSFRIRVAEVFKDYCLEN